MSIDERLKDYTAIYIFLILSIAFLLRLILLASIPNGFYCDEASNGYDAYSILKTLHDRYGEFLPLFARALNDYRPSLYIFITIPFIKVFGLNEFATRLPAVIIGSLTVWIFYYLVREVFGRSVALIAAFLLAINPWHIQFSRVAFEAILFPLLFCLGLLFFYKSFSKPNYLLLSSLIFGLSLHTYQSARVFIPLFLLGLVIVFRKNLWRIKNKSLVAVVLFLIVFSFLFTFWISPEGMARSKAVGVHTNPLRIFRDYLSYFSPNFLFLNGDPNLRHSPQKIGQLHYFELVTVTVGIFSLLRENRKERSILLLWLLLYPIPSALTAPTHAIRSIIGLPVLEIFSAYGATKLVALFSFRRRTLFLTATFLILTVSLAIFCQRYFINYPATVKNEWQYGMREAINYAQKSSYNCVVITGNNYNCLGTYNFNAFVPFYTQYPPEQYQLLSTMTQGKEKVQNHNVGKYSMESISRQKQLNDKCLFILRPEEVRLLVAKGYNWKEIYAVKDSRGVEYFKLVRVSKQEN